MPISMLYFEGNDDLHVMQQLLRRHGIEIDNSKSTFPKFQPASGWNDLVNNKLSVAFKSSYDCLGIVLDADESINIRWEFVRNLLRKQGVIAPEVLPPDGFIGTSKVIKRVGVWIIPDNTRNGMLEHLLCDLLPPEDILYAHAQSATQKALELGAEFKESARVKAEIRAWLAWQENPGFPYGRAIGAKYFQHDHPSVLAFIDWFKRLFEIEDVSK